MDFFALINELDEQTLAPVYLLHGPEQFLIRQFTAKIRQIALSGPMRDLNSNCLRASEATGREIADCARELPMMAPRRLVIVEEGQKLSAADLEALDPYLANPVHETVLVIVADSFALRSGPLAKANRRGQVHKAEPLKEADIARFVRWRAEVRGVKMTLTAISALGAAVGSDGSSLDDAIERLGLYVGGKLEVTPEHVAEVVTAVREHSIFEFVDAIGNRDSALALSRLEQLLKSREEPLRINAMIARHMRLLLRARIALHAGSTAQEFAEVAQLPPFVAQKLFRQCRSFRGAEIERFLSRMAKSDYELKSSRRPPRIVVEHAVLDLCLA